MRLRNFFPAAAFFLTFGIAFAFALEPADEKDRRETIYPFRYPASAESNSVFFHYFFDNAGNNTLTITLFPYNGLTMPENVWSFDAAKQTLNNSANNTSDEDLSLSDDQISQSDTDADTDTDTDTDSTLAEAETTDPTANRVFDEDKHSIYDLSIPFGESIPEEIGFTGPDDSDDEYELSFLEDRFKEPKDSQLSDNGPYSSLVFSKKAFLNSPNSAQILFGGAYKESFKKKDDAAGISFSTPVALFFFTLGVGIILVIFTSMEKNEN